MQLTGAADLDRTSGIAIWRQISDALRMEITSGAFASSETLPSEKVLADMFGANRHTIRSALKALALENLLVRRQGGGTRILRHSRILYPISKRTRLHDGVGLQAGDTHIVVLQSVEASGNTEISKALHLPDSSPLQRIETLSFTDNRPLAKSTNWFCARRFRGISGHISRTGSITAALKLSGIDDYLRVSTVVEAGQADSPDAGHLRVAPGALLLITTTVNAMLDGTPIHHARTRFLAERVALQFDTSIEP